METFINKVRTRFGKASLSYESVAKTQKETAAFLTERLLEDKNFNPKTILDLGTGTGFIPELLLPRLRQCSFYLNDIADEMLEACKIKFAKAENVFYLPGDMLQLNADVYDCVISNFALQWVDDWRHALKFFHSKSSDVFAFSTLLDGTFEEWENIVNQYQSIKALNYPRAENIVSLCGELKRHDQDFEFWLMDVPLSFDSSLAFMRYLKLLGASGSIDAVHLCTLKKLLKDQCRDLAVTYKIFFGVFRSAA